MIREPGDLLPRTQPQTSGVTRMKRSHCVATLAAVLAVAAALGCSDTETLNPAPSSSSSGAGGGSSSSSQASSSSHASSSSSSGGGGGVTCLDPSMAADLFTIEKPGFCVVAV